MTSLSNIRNLIAQLDEEDDIYDKETQKHFENQHKKYQEMFEKFKDVQERSEKCMGDITKGLDNLVHNQHTIEKALKQTDNLEGLPISPEQQENAVDLVKKMIKFMNNTEVISSPNSISPEQIQIDVASFTSDVAEELKDYKNDLRQVISLTDHIQLLKLLTTNSEKYKDDIAKDSPNSVDGQCTAGTLAISPEHQGNTLAIGQSPNLSITSSKDKKDILNDLYMIPEHD